MKLFISLLFLNTTLGLTQSLNNEQIMHLKVTKEITIEAGKRTLVLDTTIPDVNCTLTVQKKDTEFNRIIEKGRVFTSTRFNQGHSALSIYQMAVVTGKDGFRDPNMLYILCNNKGIISSEVAKNILSDYFEINFSRYPNKAF